MDASTLTVDSPLPTDVPTLHGIIRQLLVKSQELERQFLARIEKLEAENAELKAKLDAALKHRFGRRSERRTPPPGVGLLQTVEIRRLSGWFGVK